MTRINSILQSNLFSNGRFRGIYIEIFERCFSEKIGSDISLLDIPYSVFLSNFGIEKVLSNAFTYLKNYQIFEHSPDDNELRKLFFIYSTKTVFVEASYVYFYMILLDVFVNYTNMNIQNYKIYKYFLFLMIQFLYQILH